MAQLLAENPGWISRYRLSRELARPWDWHSACGQLKDMAARTLLLKLEERGFIRLPPRRRASPNRMRHRQVPALDPRVSQEPIRTGLANLQPLAVREVSVEFPAERGLFEALLHRFHYLSYRSPVGENLLYLARERSGRPVACLLFGAAAWQCADRDRYIGWDAATRAARLHLSTNNTRMLVMPWVESRCLASHVLGLVLRRNGSDSCAHVAAGQDCHCCADLDAHPEPGRDAIDGDRDGGLGETLLPAGTQSVDWSAGTAFRWRKRGGRG